MMHYHAPQMAPRPRSASRALWVVLGVGAVVTVALACVLFTYREQILGIFSEPLADTKSPRAYEADGLSFDYPGNWTATTEVTNEAGITVDAITVESAGTCMAIINRFHFAVDAKPDTYITAYSDALNQQSTRSKGLLRADQKHVTNFDGVLAGGPAKGQRVDVRVDALGEGVPVVFEVLVRKMSNDTLVLVTSCPSEDLPKARGGFTLIRESLALGGGG